MGTFARNRSRIAGTSFFLFCVSLFLTAYSARNPWTGALGSSLSSSVLRPLQVMYRGGVSGIAGVWRGYVALIGVQRENNSLRSRLTALEVQNSKLTELESENRRLRDLVGFVEPGVHRAVSARVIGHNASNWMQVLTVSAGTSDGVKTGMPALQGNGVVGQIISAGARSARVLLVTDPSSGVDAIIQGSRVRGVVIGTGDGCVLDHVLSEDDVKIGDRVITSGMDGVYPKGLLVGVVANVEPSAKGSNMFQFVSVTPTVDFSRLEEVLLVTPLQPAEIAPAPRLDAKRQAGRKKGGAP